MADRVKVIIFDVGGTYTQGSIEVFVNQAYGLLGIKKKIHLTKEVIFDPALNKGTIGLEKCFEKYFHQSISQSQMGKLRKLWLGNWQPESRMIKLVKSLKKKYRLAILSNSEAEICAHFFKKGWYEPFQPIILSHELGVLKPGKKIYQIALEKIGIAPGECLFIDDQEDCLKTARGLGMKTILFATFNQFKKDLAKKVKF